MILSSPWGRVISTVFTKSFYNTFMNEIFQTLEEKLGRGRVKMNEPLSLHTSFKIGGPAQFYYEANSSGEVAEAAKTAEELKLPYLLLGGGSNILVGDKGFPGLVIRNKSQNIKILGYMGKVKSRQSQVENVLVEVDAGVPFNQLVRFTIEEGLEGLEEFLGLPGTVGGAVIDNSHWQDKKIDSLIVSQKTADKGIILSVVLGLKKGDKNLLWQRARQAVEYRQRTQPLSFPSAGCTFRNIKKSEALRIGTPNLTTSAGFLVEAAGFKGTQVGNAQVSTVHANFIVNLGGASASDVLELINLIKTKVKEKFKVSLKEEIVRVGDF